jgi:hypothetical protein
MSLSSEGYFPKRDWLARMPGSKTQHEDIIESDADAREEVDLSLNFDSDAAADAMLAMYVDAAAVSPVEGSELTMPVSEALRRVEAEVGSSVVAEVFELPDQRAA